MLRVGLKFVNANRNVKANLMNYQEALKLKKESECLIGTRDPKGFIVDVIIIVPSDEKDRADFFKACVFNYDFRSAILPFISTNLEVWTLDLEHLQSVGLVVYNKISI